MHGVSGGTLLNEKESGTARRSLERVVVVGCPEVALVETTFPQIFNLRVPSVSSRRTRDSPATPPTQESLQIDNAAQQEGVHSSHDVNMKIDRLMAFGVLDW